MNNVALILVALGALSACKRDVEQDLERQPGAEAEQTAAESADRESAARDLAAREKVTPTDQTRFSPTAPDVLRELQGDPDEQDPGMTPASRTERKATGSFKAAKGIELKGEAKLSEHQDGVHVSVEIENGPPGKKAIHVHQKGDCSDIPGKSMGEHFNPLGKPHGLPSSPERHAGDLGNITIDQKGKAKLDMHLPQVNLKSDDRMSLIGKALVIHASEDKGTQPSGQAGAPIACAVLTKD